ncbi:Conserved_hypothetical protein [Hexamita inflata]|uniref:Uncharacterized protein n=1 Tax=Hexamita inflata TaxID=28002 RepID=A0AA86NKM0_9EUKA|nr:Conserved hypothetical protein [Hexamita inflata]
MQIPPSFSLYLIAKKKQQIKQFSIKPQQYEEQVNVFEIPVSKDIPYQIPGTNIGVKTSVPIDAEKTPEAHKQLLDEVQNELERMKAVLKMDNIKPTQPLEQDKHIEDAVENLSHKDKLKVINDLFTVKKGLENAQKAVITKSQVQPVIRLLKKDEQLAFSNTYDELYNQKFQASQSQNDEPAFVVNKKVQQNQPQKQQLVKASPKEVPQEHQEDQNYQLKPELKQQIENSINLSEQLPRQVQRKQKYQKYPESKPQDYRKLMPMNRGEHEIIADQCISGIMNTQKQVDIIQEKSMQQRQAEQHHLIRPCPEKIIKDVKFNIITGKQIIEGEQNQYQDQQQEIYQEQQEIEPQQLEIQESVQKPIEQKPKKKYQKQQFPDQIDDQIINEQVVIVNRDDKIKKHLQQIIKEKELFFKQQLEKKKKSYAIPHYNKSILEEIQKLNSYYQIESISQNDLAGKFCSLKNKWDVFETICNQIVSNLIIEQTNQVVEGIKGLVKTKEEINVDNDDFDQEEEEEGEEEFEYEEVYEEEYEQ